MGERILIRREPTNQYDSNAIRVDNVRSQQIGHIPRQMAAKLAKYIDNKWLSLDGILIGEKGAFDCPIRIVRYGPVDPRDQEAVKDMMVKDNLPIQSLREREAQDMARRKDQLKKAAASASATRGMKRQQPNSDNPEFAPSQNEGQGGDAPDVEDFMQASIQFNPREMGQLVEKFLDRRRSAGCYANGRSAFQNLHRYATVPVSRTCMASRSRKPCSTC